MVSRAFFVITDITGYTEFLTQSGLEEAQSILDHLYTGFLEAFKPPLIISNFQGDAVLAYAPEGSFSQGQTFLSLIEGLYFAFAGLVERMERSAACSCDACDNLPKLDLKIFVHFGQYTIQKIREREELTGPDVIIAHRMMKNPVREDTGYKSYVLFTEQALRHLNPGEWTPDMHAFSAEYAHLGKVQMYAYDLRPRYKAWKIHQRIFVRPDQAAVSMEKPFPVQPHVVWEFLTQPRHLKKWMAFEAVLNADGPSTRLEQGTVFRCIRKTDNVDFTITDWRPFEYFTMESTGESGIPFEATFSFLRTSSGTLMKVFARPLDNAPENAANSLRNDFMKNLHQLELLLLTEMHATIGHQINPSQS